MPTKLYTLQCYPSHTSTAIDNHRSSIDSTRVLTCACLIASFRALFSENRMPHNNIITK